MKIISLGAGVQSSAMLLMSDRGLIPKADYAIFADTGAEPDKVYEWLEMLKTKVSIPVITTSKGNLLEDLLGDGSKRFASIPFFSIDKNGKKGMLRRQCTAEYKLTPIQKMIRKLYGAKPRQRNKEQIEVMIGISTDEVRRVKPSRIRYLKNVYPLITAKMNRQHCINYVEKEIGQTPPRSACWFCPFHDDHEWKQIKENDPKGWQASLDVEKALNLNPRFKSQAFLHASRVPLDQVIFKETPEDTQGEMFDNECEGMCGI